MPNENLYFTHKKIGNNETNIACYFQLGGLSIEELLERFVRPESVYDVECTGCAKKMKRKDGAPLPKATFVKKLTIGKVLLPRENTYLGQTVFGSAKW